MSDFGLAVVEIIVKNLKQPIRSGLQNRKRADSHNRSAKTNWSFGKLNSTAKNRIKSIWYPSLLAKIYHKTSQVRFILVILFEVFKSLSNFIFNQI
jgi:hypothetical protein